MAVSSADALGLESRAGMSWRKAEAARREYARTVDEIEDRFNLLLGLRDSVIERLEEKLTRLRTRIEVPDRRLNFKVLVVEESPDLRVAIVAALQRKFQAFGAVDSTTALECLIEKPDVILTDVRLPGTHVGAMIRQMWRGAGRRLPIMAIYDPEDKDLVESIRGLGLRAAFRKPFRLKEIVAGVEALCADARGSAEISGQTGPVASLPVSIGKVASREMDCPQASATDTARLGYPYRPTKARVTESGERKVKQP